MSFALRSVIKQSSQSIRGALFKYGQVRSTGNLPIKPNKYVEEWNKYREEIEHTFRFTPKNLINIAIWVVAVPILLYKGIVAHYDACDEAYGRPKKRFM